MKEIPLASEMRDPLRSRAEGGRMPSGAWPREAWANRGPTATRVLRHARRLT